MPKKKPSTAKVKVKLTEQNLVLRNWQHNPTDPESESFNIIPIGTEIELPKGLADNLIKQGLAEKA